VVYEDGRITKIASAVVGPKPARPIPILVPANTPRAMRRLVDHADGWLPYADGPDQVAASRRRLQDLAAKRFEGPDRRPFQGDVEQIVADLMDYAEIGLDEFLVDLSWAARDAQELKGVAAEVYSAARAAGF
jgi:alkanesulfonate monooxygenase SsuD/methylene tetrahydromethanopterin reductase-like flavin-dependent oxidoreductase (luciferase family)